MGIQFRLIFDQESINTLVIHPDNISLLGINDEDKPSLQFGQRIMPIKIFSDQSISKVHIRISDNIAKHLLLPLSPLYELQLNKHQLLIGPYIGLLASTTHQFLSKRVQYLASFVEYYAQIGGAILAFSLEGVDPTSSTILGFMYNPHSETWEEGEYAYPASLFSFLEVSMTPKWEPFLMCMNHFYSILGKQMFNYPIFDKWDMYRYLNQDPQIQKHVPKTVLYQEPDDIYEMLEKYQTIYIKPILGRLGLGVIKAQLDHEGVVIHYRKKKKNYQLLLPTSSKFQTYFQQQLSFENYILQPALDLITYKERVVDFRLILVKNEQGNWSNLGLFGRYGSKKSIVSNITEGGFAEPGSQTLKKTLNFSDEEAQHWCQFMNQLAIRATKLMEEQGFHCGNLGLDLAIDTHRKLWILEINNQNPDHNIARVAGQEDVFLQARLLNMLYCRLLAGFSKDEQFNFILNV